jgi:hypothetical protein
VIEDGALQHMGGGNGLPAMRVNHAANATLPRTF